ncbi:hypothetical protein [Nitrospira moscoviensis]|uniref:Lipoprotein n=1 Tax=Nitrospira moscoviensis TaxID=42253 RepID=A0A0K2G8H7_NITMO|nr:hypothetical protein [Nitrospira moscoviensis]ALA57276.1 hypothetical protein NITMOv2_0841 [Nitrospira moscoviensis]
MTGGVIYRAISWLGCFAVLVGIGAGCSGSKVTTRASAELPRYTIKTIAVVPFNSIATPQVQDQGESYLSAPPSVRRSDISVSVPSNTEPLRRQTVTVPPYAAEKITQLFWAKLQKKEGLRVLAGGEAARTVASEATTPESVGAAAAQRLKADAALIGQVRVYQERVGSRLGASPPATVGFGVKVVAADGQVLWVGNYYERQRPITEDFMGALHRWGAFVAADELAQYGVDELLKEFPFGTEGAR